MSKFWSPIVDTLEPYIPGEQPKVANLVKLNTNENPYGPSPKVITAIKQAADDSLRLYPDPNSDKLKQTLADYYHVAKECVFVGNGSDEVLAHIFNALFQHQAPLLFPDITYSFYPVYCRLYQIDYQTIPLDDDLSIRVSDYQQANGGIIFPNPNAPTGRLLALSEIERLLKFNTGSVVVIDEAYIDFGGQSAITLVEHYPNLLVTQTVSKSRSLAGMRVGFAIGHPDLIEALVRVKDSFNSYPLDSLATAAAIAAFDDQAYFEETCQKIIASRDQLVLALSDLGFEISPSTANFIFVKHGQYDAEYLALTLRQSGVIVRHFKQERIKQFLRITLGNEVENQQLLALLTNLIKD